MAGENNVLKFADRKDFNILNTTKGPFGDSSLVETNTNWAKVYGFPRSRVYPKPIRSDTPGRIERIQMNPGIYEYTVNRFGLWTFIGSAQFVATQMTLATGDPIGVTVTSTKADAAKTALKAYAKLGQGRFNAAVFIGELKPSVRMITKRARQLQTAMRNLQQGNWKGFGEVLPKAAPPSRRQRAQARDKWSDIWLEYTYGWSPLVSDVYGAVQAVQKGISGAGTTVSSRSGRGGLGRGRERGSGDSASNMTGTLANSAVFSGIVSNPEARTLQELGLANPAALAWELLPFSFVADWFLPIGDILAALTVGVGLSGIVGSVVYEERRKSDGFRSGIWRRTEQDVMRIPVVPLWAILNSLSAEDGLSESWRRMTSAIALLHQQANRPVGPSRGRR